jgi:hypothetical protein
LNYWFRERHPVLLLKGWWSGIHLRDLDRERVGYELTGAILYILVASGDAHVWSCVIRDDKGYIFDSAHPERLWKCDWWKAETLTNFLQKSNIMAPWPEYKPNVAKDIRFNLVMYTRKEFTNKIAPRCVRMYKPLTKNNENKVLNLLIKNPNVGKRANKLNIPPIIKAELTARQASRTNMAKWVYNAIIENSINKQNALNSLHNAQVYHGLRVNKNSPLYRKFIDNLNNKYRPPLPSNVYFRAVRQHNTRTAAVAAVNKYANQLKYAINKNGKNYKNFLNMLNNKFKSPKRKSLNVK